MVICISLFICFIFFKMDVQWYNKEKHKNMKIKREKISKVTDEPERQKSIVVENFFTKI